MLCGIVLFYVNSTKTYAQELTYQEVINDVDALVSQKDYTAIHSVGGELIRVTIIGQNVIWPSKDHLEVHMESLSNKKFGYFILAIFNYKGNDFSPITLSENNVIDMNRNLVSATADHKEGVEIYFTLTNSVGVSVTINNIVVFL